MLSRLGYLLIEKTRSEGKGSFSSLASLLQISPSDLISLVFDNIFTSEKYRETVLSRYSLPDDDSYLFEVLAAAPESDVVVSPVGRALFALCRRNNILVNELYNRLNLPIDCFPYLFCEASVPPAFLYKRLVQAGLVYSNIDMFIAAEDSPYKVCMVGLPPLHRALLWCISVCFHRLSESDIRYLRDILAENKSTVVSPTAYPPPLKLILERYHLALKQENSYYTEVADVLVGRRLSVSEGAIDALVEENKLLAGCNIAMDMINEISEDYINMDKHAPVFLEYQKAFVEEMPKLFKRIKASGIQKSLKFLWPYIFYTSSTDADTNLAPEGNTFGMETPISLFLKALANSRSMRKSSLEKQLFPSGRSSAVFCGLADITYDEYCRGANVFCRNETERVLWLFICIASNTSLSLNVAGASNEKRRLAQNFAVMLQHMTDEQASHIRRVLAEI